MNGIKLNAALSILQDDYLYVGVNPKHERVIVPPNWKAKEHMILQVGYQMPVPIRDLHIDADGVSGIFSFDRVPSLCVIPWESVTALARGEEYTIAFIPNEALAHRRAPVPAPTPRPGLRLVK